MLYALLCYNDEKVVWSWDRAQEDKVMAQLGEVRERLQKAGKLGPSLRLMPTTAATTLRKSDPPLIIDGPFAETKEQLLGLYILDVGGLDEALEVPGGSYEVRPLALYDAGAEVA
jgi:hypothetical protein